LPDKTGLTISTAGSHTYYVKVDSGGAVAESNEGDNVGSATVTVNPPVSLPNLTVSNPQVHKASSGALQTVFFPGVSHYVSGTVNSGIAAPSKLTFTVGLFVNCNPDVSSCGVPDKEASVSIAKGATSADFTLPSISQSSEGAYTYYIKADTANTVEESNEGDNTSRISISVLGWGPSCSITPLDRELNSRETINYSATVTGLSTPYVYSWTNTGGFFNNATSAAPVWTAQYSTSNRGIDGGTYQIGLTVATKGTSDKVLCSTEACGKN
jgi:hypothetical protein